MEAPNSINVVLNAADGIDLISRFLPDVAIDRALTIEELSILLGKQAGRLFRLHGFTNSNEYSLAISGVVVDTNALFVKCKEPPFEQAMVVANEPPPSITMHGDYTFTLAVSEQTSN